MDRKDFFKKLAAGAAIAAVAPKVLADKDNEYKGLIPAITESDVLSEFEKVTKAIPREIRMSVFSLSKGKDKDITIVEGGDPVEFLREGDNAVFTAQLKLGEKLKFRIEHGGRICVDEYDVNGVDDFEIPQIFERFVSYSKQMHDDTV